MTNMTQTRDRRTSVDVVFDHLRDEIASLRLLPGDKISEAEIAAKFGVSRQPVRDAFSRLENLDLLLIRPQRATEVKRFSTREIEKSRFVRIAIESEVLRRAAAACDAMGAAQIDAALAIQAAVVDMGDYAKFGKLDYEFHKTLCDIAGVDFAFEVISEEKA
ncbi:MAG: GntR family transcriptional regulator, partial [Octadecabacter sp.]